MVQRYDFHEDTEYPWWASITPQGDGGYVLHSDYEALERRLVELQEAVAWERECEDFDRWADAMCRAWSCEWDDVVHTARDEVDRLIANDAADCKGEG